MSDELAATPTGRVRQAVHDGPSEREFVRICRGLDVCTPAQRTELLPFVERRVAAWPDTMRVAPDAWAAEALAGRVDGRWSLVRRLIVRDGRAAAAWAETAALRQIVELEVEGADRSLATLLGTPRARQLTRLAVRAPREPEAVASGIARAELPHLAALELDGVPLDGVAAERVLARRTVSALRIVRGGLTLDDFRRLASARGAEELGELDLSDNAAGDHAVAALAASDHLRNLQRLNLSRCALTDLGRRALEQSRTLGQLANLAVDDVALDAGALVDAVADGRWPNLEALSVFGAALDEARVATLLGARTWRALGFSGIDAIGAGHLASTGFLGTALALRDGHLSAGAATAIASGAPAVEELALVNVGLDDDGWTAIVQGLAALETLDVSNNVIRGARAPRAGLVRLVLARNPIDDVGVETMIAAGTFSGLLGLDVSDCAISARGRDALAAIAERSELGDLRC